MLGYGQLGTAFAAHSAATFAGDHLVTAFAPLSCGFTNGDRILNTSKTGLSMLGYGLLGAALARYSRATLAGAPLVTALAPLNYGLSIVLCCMLSSINHWIWCVDSVSLV